ncbi:MAG: class I SAM-dependent methyltransferase [Butyrivibrio sp.]|nr:class I SAM-dependent methyltransferase [Butyrivibrio sp.]
MKYEYRQYWDKCWKEENAAELHRYLEGYYKLNSPEIDFFKQNSITNVCDAACGFGAYSLAFASNGFKVSAFDISETAVEIATNALEKYGLSHTEIKIASILETGYDDSSFDGVIAHAVLDHLTVKDAKKALTELLRITRKDGLVMVSFDIPEEDDLTEAHILLEDGTLQYTCQSRSGMLFHPYDREAIEELTKDYNVVYKADKGKRERIVIIKRVE